MQCYLINLDRSADRLEFMENEFKRNDLSFVRVPAVDGRLLSDNERYAVMGTEQRADMPISPSEIGCFLSHRKCLELIAGASDPYAAIFEDDVALSNDAHHFLKADTWIPKGSDVIKIETHGQVIQIENLTKVAATSRYIGQLLSKHVCMGGYIVSKEAAQHILKYMDKISLPVDYLFFDPGTELGSKLKIYQLTPAICHQVGLDSLIEADRQSYRPPTEQESLSPRTILRRIMRPYRRVSYLFSPKKIWLRLTTKKRWMRVPFRL